MFRNPIAIARVAAALLVAALPLAASPAFAQFSGDAPIRRPYAVVSRLGRDLPKLIGVPIDRLRVARVGKGGALPVPFQVDQRDAAGALIFPFGPRADRREADRVFDATDEVLWMAFDAGPVVPDDARRALGPQATIVRAADPATAAVGEVVVFAADPSAPRSTVDYVSFEEKKHLTRAIGYELGSRPEAPGHVMHMAPGPPGRRRNILDRLKMRAEGNLFGVYTLTRNEEDLVSRLLAYVDGPVRVVLKTDYALRAIWGLRTPMIERETPFYAYEAHFPNRMKVPFRLGRIFTEATLRSGFDFRPEMGKAKLYSNRFAGPVVIDGRMDEIERGLAKYRPTWFVITGEFGCMMFYLVVNRDLAKTGVTATLDYTDDVNVSRPPENVPGSYGQTLYRMEHVLDIPRGDHRFDVVFYFPPACEGRAQDAALVEWENPLTVTVR